MQNIMSSGIHVFNVFLKLLKYPVAFIVFVSTFFWMGKLYDVGDHIISHYVDYQYMLIGMGAYILLWKIVFHDIGKGWFATFEHEITHVLFALLTFHRVQGFTVTDTGGYVEYRGSGNWLISISPYFFPTISVFIIGFMYLVTTDVSYLLMVLLGFSIVYHIHSTWYELHLEQTDLQKEGFFFAWIFLPGANFMSFVLVLSLIPNDKIYIDNIYDQYYLFIIKVLSLQEHLFGI